MGAYRAYFDGRTDQDGPAIEAYESILADRDHILPRDEFSVLVRMAHLYLHRADFKKAQELLDQAYRPRLFDTADEVGQAWIGALQNRLFRERDGAKYEPFAERWAALRESMRSTVRTGGVAYHRIASIREITFEVIEQAIQDGGASAGFAALLDIGRGGFLENELQPQPVALDRFLSSLDPGELCLAFHAGQGRYHAFAVSEEAVLAHWLVEGRADLRNQCSDLNRKVFGANDVGRDSYAVEAAMLRDTLIPSEYQPLLAEYPRLRIITREAVYNAPVELFELPDGPIGLTHAISDWPTVGVALLLRERAEQSLILQRANRPGLDWLCVADPEISPAAQALTPGQESLVLDLPDGPRLVNLEGKQAQFGRALGYDSLAIQFLCHGVQRDVPEWSACLALTPEAEGGDGLVNGEQILANQDATWPPLVVLSTCQAAAGRERMGDPAAGRLAGAILARGRSRF
ncbi:MAG: CHAT domain-containing protein [Planctomycetota bacterium]